MRWDVFCRVIDNWGDVGVCWRLAADLARRGDAVRLWLDDASALAWMAPQGAPGVQVRPWAEAQAAPPPPGDVVVEAFGCDPPPAFVAAMAAAAPPPVWINLEYLSAEPFVERSHGLPSPQLAGPGRGLTKWFFYPGFGAGTGGLLREPDLAARQAAFDADAWRAAQGWPAADGERDVLLFCYRNPALPALRDALASAPTRLLTAAGPATEQSQALQAVGGWPSALRLQPLPLLPQADFDHLLWCAELNLVRGEDSLVRALWAGRPFVWQLYPQHDGAHGPKLAAFLDRLLDGAPAALAAAVRRCFAVWNGLDAGPLPTLDPALLADWRAWTVDWRGRLLAQPDLVTALRAFVRRQGPAAAGADRPAG
ncbi:elongation factor P maturation arginine rhamnosyltransferase EarP [Aquabacterium sp. J223]|uniref:elongation factor P maturation arginine rhamnosyltransferase EarP n=1 Tax=Aquabacterium sp. J223 TaxID=2898431 RepID=UPI0021ADBC92|nr:elongation factor P maturation arginine rhamnosyltransferase EarP [Aquabacterium sp. J223]UUX97089.1 elongation factor P maturation arginine rhamnosyltransferase EarP [Aquabacterium sp. J223]